MRLGRKTLLQRTKENIEVEVSLIGQYLKGLPTEMLDNAIHYLETEIVGKMGDSGRLTPEQPVGLLEARFDTPGVHSYLSSRPKDPDRKTYKTLDDIDDYLADYAERRLNQEEEYCLKISRKEENVRRQKRINLLQRVIYNTQKVFGGQVPDRVLDRIVDKLDNETRDKGPIIAKRICAKIFEDLGYHPELAKGLTCEDVVIDKDERHLSKSGLIVEFRKAY